MNTPTAQQIARARNNAGITQTAAADMVHSKLRTWQDWEGGRAKMHAGLWELFKRKLRERGTQ